MQRVERFGTYPESGGKHVYVEDKINAWLAAHPDHRITQIHPIRESRANGYEYSVLVVFEPMVETFGGRRSEDEG